MKAFAKVLLLSIVSLCGGKSLVTVPDVGGTDVVDTAVDLIRTRCILARDNLFLRRLAYVESKDGSRPMMRSPEGGIWQVTQSMLQETKNNAAVLRPLYTKIQKYFNIDWTNVVWTDLRKPLYSGLAAALFLKLKSNQSGQAIPVKVEEQGAFWEKYYHSGSTANNYTVTVQQLQQGCRSSNRQVDLVFLVDTSSSLSKDDFLRVQRFLKEVVNGFNVSYSTVRVAVVTYSTQAHIEFYLNSHYSNSAVNSAIDGMVYRPGSTNTAGAMSTALNNVFVGSRGGRQGAIKVVILITDGRSDDLVNTLHAANNLNTGGIAVFAVGVGSLIDGSELKQTVTKPDCTHAYTSHGFDSIINLKQEIQHSVCRAPLYTNTTVICTMATCPPIGFIFPPNNTGLTIQANISCGTVVLYTDLNNLYPNKAHNILSKVVGQNMTVFYQAQTDASYHYLYVNVKDENGYAGRCTVTLVPLPGNQVITGVEVLCRDLPYGHLRKCTKKELAPYCGGSQCFAQNPCSSADAKSGRKYPCIGDITRYVQCLPSGMAQIVHCPGSTVFDPKCQVCYGRNAPQVVCSTSYNGNNPCTATNLLNNKFYFEFPGDHTKYIQCDIWGHPWIRQCISGYVWVQVHETCEYPTVHGYNPCYGMKSTGTYLFAYPASQCFYIECVDELNPQKMSCPTHEGWDDTLKTCVPISNCNIPAGATNPQFLTSPTAPVSFGHIGPQYTYPCTPQHISNNQLYFPVKWSKHQFIQCDLNGYGYVKFCQGSDCFDPNSNTCVDGCVFIDGSLNHG